MNSIESSVPLSSSSSSSLSSSVHSSSKLAIPNLLSPSEESPNDLVLCFFYTAPRSILIRIISYLNKQDWFTLQVTCQFWYRFFQDSKVWSALLRPSFLSSSPSTFTPPSFNVNFLRSRFFRLLNTSQSWNSIHPAVFTHLSLINELELLSIVSFAPTHDHWMIQLDLHDLCLVFTIFPCTINPNSHSSIDFSKEPLKYRYFFAKGQSIQVADIEYTTQVALVKIHSKPVPPSYTMVDILHLATSYRLASIAFPEDPLVLVKLYIPPNIELYLSQTYQTLKGQRHFCIVAGYPFHLLIRYYSKTTPVVCMVEKNLDFEEELLDFQWNPYGTWLVSIHEDKIAYVCNVPQCQLLHRISLSHEPNFPNSLHFLPSSSEQFHFLTLSQSSSKFKIHHSDPQTPPFTFPLYSIPKDTHHELDPHVLVHDNLLFLLTQDFYLVMYDVSLLDWFSPVCLAKLDVYTLITQQKRFEKNPREVSRWLAETKLLGLWLTTTPSPSIWMYLHRKHMMKELVWFQPHLVSSSTDPKSHSLPIA